MEFCRIKELKEGFYKLGLMLRSRGRCKVAGVVKKKRKGVYFIGSLVGSQTINEGYYQRRYSFGPGTIIEVFYYE